jgi:hypothetical protein
MLAAFAGDYTQAMRNVRVEWKWIEWNVNFKWREQIVPQLEKHGLTENDLRTCVYVIVADGLFAIDYPKRVSPTLYIGSGNFKSRLAQHESWLSEITHLVHDYRFSIAVCRPKTRDGQHVHKAMEAALLREFVELHGCIPIRNKKMEHPQEDFNYVPYEKFKKPLIIGRGYRYHWAIRPLNSNPYHRSFVARS